MLYTRKGDGGTSGLFGTKERYPKSSPIYHALGSVDELNSLLGICRAKARTHESPVNLEKIVENVEQHLFIVQAEIAGADHTLTSRDVLWLEERVAMLESDMTPPRSFVVPGANELSAFFDFARAVARRAERSLIETRLLREVSKETYAYMNRLSSLLYALARYSAESAQEIERVPTYNHAI